MKRRNLLIGILMACVAITSFSPSFAVGANDAEKSFAKPGMHSLAACFAITKDGKFEQSLDQCEDAGIGLVEIPFSGIQIPHDDLAEMFRKRDLAVAVTVFSAGPDAPNPLAGGEQEEAALKEIENAILLAKKFEAAGVECVGITGPWGIKIGAPGELPALLAFMERVAKIAERYEIKCHFEPLREAEDLVCHSTYVALGILKRINSPWLGLHLDTFHSDLNDEDGIRKAIETAGRWLTYVHASGTLRAIPGADDDDIGWNEASEGLDAIDYGGWVTIECFGEGATAEISDIVTGLATPRSFADILVISMKTLRDAGIIAPLE